MIVTFTQLPDILTNYIKTQASNKETITIGLSGGRSLDDFYPHLSDTIEALSSYERSLLRFCMLDERIVPLDHADSNYHSIYEKFFSNLLEKQKIEKSQLLSINPTHPQLADQYSTLVGSINIALFGVGEDGHIASLFPHHSLLHVGSKQFITINDSPKPPPSRITLSVSMIEDIDISIVFFVGASKEQARQDFLDSRMSEEDLPAKFALRSKKSYAIRL